MPQSQEERLQELTDKLEDGIKDLCASGRYAEYLAAMAKFHHYSVGNVALILLQCPTATQVAGYTRWKKDFGRQVKKGEHGISILCPCSYRWHLQQPKIDPNTGRHILGADGKPLTETVIVKRTLYKIGTVFDVSQTEGRELPGIVVSELVGEVERFQDLYDCLSAISPVPIMEDSVPGKAKGYFSAEQQRIVLRSGMPQLQTMKTLVHEIAHAKLHDYRGVPVEKRKDRSQKEVEAESVAYVVCQHFGLDTSDYSFGYVAGWSSGKELNDLKTSLDVIHTTAGEMISKIEATLGLTAESVQTPQKVTQHQR